jgi:hypothetical protein
MAESGEDNKSEKVSLGAVAAINATLLGILIAFVAAYAIYVKDSLRSAEFEAVSEAEKINTVFFARSCYFPDGLDDFSKMVNKKLEFDRKRMSIAKFEEPEKTSLLRPANAKDLEELSRYLDLLHYPFGTLNIKEGEYSIGNNKYLPRDAANRGEEILRVLNLMGHCHLFPDPPFETDATFSKSLQKRIYFKNIKDAADWADGAEAFLYAVKKIKFNMTVFESSSKLFDALMLRDKKLIKQWESSPITKGYGRLDPNYLFADFLANSQKVQSIADDTRFKINRFNKLKERYPSSTEFFILLSALALLLIIGVALPLTWAGTPKWLYLLIPIWSGVAIYVIIAVRLIIM